MGKKGFSLLEVMIVVVIISITAAVAIPSYNGYVKRTRRSDALTALQTVTLFEEKARAETGVYKSESALVSTFGLKPAAPPNYTPSEYYTIQIDVDDPPTTFRAYAVPQGSQTGDYIFVINQDGTGGTAASAGGTLTPDPGLWKTLRK